LVALQNSGCTDVLIGIESGSKWILEQVVNKKYNADTIRSCVRLFSHSSVKARYNFITGLPGETKQDLNMSLELAKWMKKVDQNCYIVFDTYASYPGTKLYEKVVDKPYGMKQWAGMTLTRDPLYYISGLATRDGGEGLTAMNFPGLKRLKILPFEVLAKLRWKFKYFKFFKLEQILIKKLYENCNSST
jgi:radical SAM superfamily enzyme YgiQ (UPF0313 family)